MNSEVKNNTGTDVSTRTAPVAIDNTGAESSFLSNLSAAILSHDPEEVLWEGKPSRALMSKSLLFWAILFVIWFGALKFFDPDTLNKPVKPNGVAAQEASNSKDAKNAPAPKGKTTIKRDPEKEKADKAMAAYNAQIKAYDKSYSSLKDIHTYLLWGGLLFVYELYAFIAWALRIGATRYRLSSQRLTVESGIFTKAINNYEIHALGNGHVYQPFYLRLFGLYNVYISGVWLYGIPNGETVRDLVRNAGQIEASRIEKANFR